MNQTVQAIFSNGMLKPLGPLNLREEELVVLTVTPIADDTSDNLSEEDFSYQPMPPRTTTYGCAQYVLRGKGIPLPYEYDPDQ
jgi:predicted DNA-binding antitoxin AbrB/MazE fold protein